MNQHFLTAHCLVKNEQRWVWYAINSVIDYVDELLVWDTGSTDNTVEIIQSIASPKIKFKEVGSVDVATHTLVRQQMLTATHSNWLLILDGDEIWPDRSIRAATDFIKSSPSTESVVVRTHNLVGDIYHRLPDSAGHYHLAGHTGHLNLRFINLNLIPGLHVAKPHGQQGYFDSQNRLIQDRDPAKVVFLAVSYHHATHLVRSRYDLSVPKRLSKLKYELGQKIPNSEIPQIYFKPHPAFVPDVTQPAPVTFWFISALQTPLRRLRRKLFPPSHGY